MFNNINFFYKITQFLADSNNQCHFLILSMVFLIWIIVVNYNCYVYKEFRKLSSRLYSYRPIAVMICFPFFVLFITIIYDFELYLVFNMWILLITFIVYKYVLFKYLSHNKYYRYCKIEHDPFFKDLRLKKFLTLKEFLELENPLKKQYILKITFLFFNKNFYFETLNILGNIYFINFFFNNKINRKKLIFFGDGETVYFKYFVINKKDWSNLLNIHYKITNFFVFFFLFIIILSTIIGLYFKKNSKKLENYYYLYKYSYINVFINATLVFLWYDCYSHSYFSGPGAPHIYFCYKFHNVVVITLTPNLHLFSIIWGSFHLRVFCHLLGTLMNSYFEFDVEKSKPYTWFYYYIYNFMSGFILAYASYILISMLILFNLNLF